MAARCCWNRTGKMVSWVLESWVVSELTQCWCKNRHCSGAQGNGPGSPVPCASLSYPLSGSSKHLSTKEEEKERVQSFGKFCLLRMFWGQRSQRWPLRLHFPGQVLRFSSPPPHAPLLSAQMFRTAWFILLSASFFHISLKK